MTLELATFLLVAAVAIFSAASMLISRNAVHSALFLVLNFMCVAFFYLMLNAPFLAMIQVTVYAGAIMVLFMFVIMLLGADKLGTEATHFRWLAPVAALLTAVFLLIAMVVLLNGNIGTFNPIPRDPRARVVHALPGVAAVDVYLNNQKAASALDYTQATDFSAVPPGQYTIAAYPTCTLADKSKCTDPIGSKAKPVLSAPFKLDADTVTTFVVSGTADKPTLLAIPTSLEPMDDDDALRLTAINAIPGDAVTLVTVNPADQKETPVFTDKPDLATGEVSKTVVMPKGNYTMLWKRGNNRVAALTDYIAAPRTNALLILTQETVVGLAAPRPTTIRVVPVLNDEVFGSPQQMGTVMLSTFLLPFELVSLLLLAALVGAIILSREEVVKRVRQRLVVSTSVRRINAATTNAANAALPASTAPANPPTVPTESSSD